MSIARLLKLPADDTMLVTWARRHGESASSLEEAFTVFAARLLQSVWETPALALQAVEHVRRAHEPALSPASKAKLIRLRAHALRGTGSAEAAVREYGKALRAFQACNAREEAGRTTVGLVFALAMIGRMNEAGAVARQGRHLLPRSDFQSRARLELNLAHAFVLAGRLGEAARRYRTALRRARRADDTASVGVCLHHLAIIAGKRGNAAAALKYFGQAGPLLEQSRMDLAVMYCNAGSALADLALGRWDDGLEALERLRRRFEQVGDRRAEGLVRWEVAAGMASLGVYETARKEARQALQNIRGLGLGSEQAALECILGRLLAARGWSEEARGYLARARRLLRARGNAWLYHRCGLEMARLLVALGRPRGALPLLNSARRTLDRLDRFGDGALCQAAMAEAQLGLRQPRRALRLAHAARRRLRHYPASLQRPAVALVVARAHSALGDDMAALRWARRAVAEQEALLQQFGGRHLRELVAESRDRIYEQAVDLVLRHGGRSAARSALDLLARARSEALVEECAVDGPGRSVHLQTQSALARLRDDLLEQPHEVDQRLRHRGLQPEIERLARRLAHEQGGTSLLLRQATMGRGLSAWAPRLCSRELVLFDRSGSTWRAFLARPDGAVELIPLPHLEQTLQDHWRPLALTMQAAASAPPDRRQEFLDRTRDDSLLRFGELTAAIWDPIPLRASSLVVVPHGELHDLPLEALAGERASTVTRLPHPALLAEAPRTQRPRRASALVLHGSTPGTLGEAQDVARVLRRSRFAVQLTGSRQVLQESRARWGVMHIATHGTMHPEGWLLSGLRLKDGWVGFESLQRPSIKGALVYLSSCESGRTTRLPGSNLKGWLAAGLGAGASELMLTLWKLDDRTGTTFAREFYGEWTQGHSAAGAATRARESLRAREPHPFAWAPFVAVGG